MTSQTVEIIKVVVAALFGGFGIKILEKLFGKKKEGLEIAKLHDEGNTLQLQIRTNIDKLISEKTADLNGQIKELSDTIVDLSVKHKKDIDNHVDRMADLEQKFDSQLTRNRTIEDELGAEVKVRQECLRQLRELQERVSKIEQKVV